MDESGLFCKAALPLSRLNFIYYEKNSSLQFLQEKVWGAFAC